MTKSSFVKYFRWILGGVLLIAGTLKILAPDNLVEVLIFFELLSERSAYVFVYLISMLEIILAESVNQTLSK